MIITFTYPTELNKKVFYTLDTTMCCNAVMYHPGLGLSFTMKLDTEPDFISFSDIKAVHGQDFIELIAPKKAKGK